MEPRQTTATVLYADISGFTAISEKLDPEELTAIMNACFESLEAVVLAREGCVDKYIGDCVMAHFGLDEVASDAPRRAVEAAAEMRVVVAELSTRFQLPVRLEVHIGIATGPVVAGNVGGTRWQEFTVTGSTVDRAESLEGLAARGEILVDAGTHAVAQEALEFSEGPGLPASIDAPPAPAYAYVAPRDARARMKRPSERRQATVIFANLLGLTPEAHHADPPAATAALNRCFAEMEAAVAENGGVVDKYIGSCLMALFGVPNAIENAPQMALNAAIAIRNRIANLRAAESQATPIQVQIGVNTGLVLAGSIGGRVKRSFTVMGDTVNLTERLKRACPPGSIYVGSETHRETAGNFSFDRLAPMQVKGKAEPVVVYELRSRVERTERRRPQPGNDGSVADRLVGRDSELESLRCDLLALAQGDGGITTLIGEAGLGKSRLVAEALRGSRAANLTVLEGHSSSVGSNLTYHPFIDLVRRWAKVAEEDDEATVGAKLQSVLAEFGPAAREAYPYVARMMNLPLSDAWEERLASIDSYSLERLIAANLRRIFQAVAEQSPVLIVLEDLHWADKSSLGLLATLVRSGVSHAMRFLLVARPSSELDLKELAEASPIGQADRFDEIRLAPLEPRATGRLVDQLVGADTLPASARRWIVEKSEGNPFFVEEVVRALIDQGAVVVEDGRPRATALIETAQIPGTIQEVILSRIDRLPEPARHVLQIASVIGRRFDGPLLTEILLRSGYPLQDPQQELHQLVALQLLVAAGLRPTPGSRSRPLHDAVSSDREYAFGHALTQQTIYEAILQKTRQALHHVVAECIEDTHADRLPEHYGMLAYHYTRGGDLDKAEDYLFRAGEAASRAAATREALSFFQEASRLYLMRHGEGGDPLKKATLRNHVGTALLGCGQLVESIEQFDAALAHLGVRPPANTAHASLSLAIDLAAVMTQLYLGRLTSAQSAPSSEVASPADQLHFHIVYNRSRALTTSDPRRLFSENLSAVRRIAAFDPTTIDEAFGIYVLAATLFGWSGKAYGVARRFSRIAAKLVRNGNVSEVFVSRFLDFGLEYLEGEWAREHLLDGSLVEEALQAGRLWDVQTYLGLACDQLLRQGEFGRAQECLDQLAEIRDVYAYEFAGTNYDGMSAVFHLEARRLGEARSASDRYKEAVSEDPLRVLAFGTRAKIETLSGRFDEAESYLESAETAIERSGLIPPWHMSAYATSRALLDLTVFEQLPDPDRTRAREREVARSLRNAIRLGRSVALPRVEAHRLAARFAWLCGRRRAARNHWQRAIGLGHELGMQPELGRTLVDAGLRMAGTPATIAGMDAKECRDRGERLLRDLGLAWDVDHARAYRSARGNLS